MRPGGAVTGLPSTRRGVGCGQATRGLSIFQDQSPHQGVEIRTFRGVVAFPTSVKASFPLVGCALDRVLYTPVHAEPHHKNAQRPRGHDQCARERDGRLSVPAYRRSSPRVIGHLVNKDGLAEVATWHLHEVGYTLNGGALRPWACAPLSPPPAATPVYGLRGPRDWVAGWTGTTAWGRVGHRHAGRAAAFSEALRIGMPPPRRKRRRLPRAHCQPW